MTNGKKEGEIDIAVNFPGELVHARNRTSWSLGDNFKSLANQLKEVLASAVTD